MPVFELFFFFMIIKAEFIRNGGQWLIGKSMTAFAPIGPGIVSRLGKQPKHVRGVGGGRPLTKNTVFTEKNKKKRK